MKQRYSEFLGFKLKVVPKGNKYERKAYASDLTEKQEKLIAPLFPSAGKKSKWEKREVVNAALDWVDNGWKWRNPPPDFPPHTTVSNFSYAAVKSGLWEKFLTALVGYTRECAGQGYEIIDSQSVNTTGAAEERGIDGGKNERPQATYCIGKAA